MMLLLRRGLVAGFVLCLVMPGLVHAQIPVTDVGNLVQNTLQVAESVLMVANMIKELLPLAEIVIGDDFQNDVSALGAVWRRVDAKVRSARKLPAYESQVWGLAPRWRWRCSRRNASRCEAMAIMRALR